MRFLRIAAKFIFILCIPVLLFTATIAAAVNCPLLYEYGFQKYNISSTTGLAPAELSKAARGLISYFNSGEEFINVTVTKNGETFELFNQREKIHLKDVKALFLLDYGSLAGTTVYAVGFGVIYLAYLRDKRQLAMSIFTGSVLTLGLMLLLGLTAVFNFSWFFLQFHLLSFANDFWMLDPSRDYLIMLFPGGFWYDAVIFILMGILGGAVIAGGISGFYLFKRGNKVDVLTGFD